MRDECTSWCTSEGLDRSKKFAIATAQSQRAKCVWISNDPSIVIDVRGLGDEDSSTFSKNNQEQHFLPRKLSKH